MNQRFAAILAGPHAETSRAARYETVYLAASLSTFGNGRYDRCLRALNRLEPGWTIIDAREQFSSTPDWRRRWPGVLGQLDALVFATDAQRIIGPGVWLEISDAYRRGLPVWLLLTSNPRLVPLERVWLTTWWDRPGDSTGLSNPLDFARVRVLHRFWRPLGARLLDRLDQDARRAARTSRQARRRAHGKGVVMATVALAASEHVRGTRRHYRALRELCSRFPDALIVEAERLDALPDRFVFMVEAGGAIDESVFRRINECDEADVPVLMLAHSGRLIPRERLRFSFFERSTPRFFARVEAFRDSRVNRRAWA